MTKKYGLVEEDSIVIGGRTLYRIRAVRDIYFDGDMVVESGEMGGYVESENNLSHEGSCWVYDDAKVYSDAIIVEDAIVSGSVEVCNYSIVRGRANISDFARVLNSSIVEDTSLVYNLAIIDNNVTISGSSIIAGRAQILNHSSVMNAEVCGDSIVDGPDADISSFSVIKGDAVITSFRDYVTFQNHWSSGRYFTYTKSNKMWNVGCFYGTSEELIEKAYKDNEESGRNYESYVNLVRSFEN